jgi:hypothetical protein
MRLMIKEYISSLREEGELDKFLKEILFIKKIIPLTNIKKGPRQHGVDIAAIGKDDDDIKKLFIITVKCGDINRKVWDGDQNAVRQSLDQIQETFIYNLTPSQKRLPIKIVVATNGYMDQTIDLDWKGFVNKHEKDNVKFEFWSLDTISDLVDEEIITTSMFNPSQLSLFRKTLALIEDNDYNLSHFQSLLNSLLDNKELKSERTLIKQLRLVNLLLNMLYKWCQDADNLRNAYLASEKVILLICPIVKKLTVDKAKHAIPEYSKILITRSNIAFSYVKKVKPEFEHKHGLSYYASAFAQDYPLICFEQIGILALVGLEHIHYANMFANEKANIDYCSKVVSEIYTSLGKLINNNPASVFPQFDDHIVDITLLLQFYAQSKAIDDAYTYLERLIHHIVDAYNNFNKFFPLFDTSYDQLSEFHFHGEHIPMTSSHLFPIIAEYSLAFGFYDLYAKIQQLCNEIWPDLKLIMWFPEENTEDTYYCTNVMHGNGSAIITTFPENYVDYLSLIKMDNEHLINGSLFPITNAFPFLPLISSRHHRNLLFPVYWRMLFTASPT